MKVKVFWQQLPATHRFVQSLEATQGVDDLTHLQTELTSETPATRGPRYFQKCINFLTFSWNDTMTLTCTSVRHHHGSGHLVMFFFSPLVILKTSSIRADVS